MKTGSSTNRMINITGLSIILLTVAVKIPQQLIPNGDLRSALGLVISALYMIFFALWGVTIRQRVIQKNTKFCLTGVAGMELFWIFIRTVKFNFINKAYVDVLRYFWYLYYLPMLMIPVICLILAILMGKPENYKPKKFLLFFPLAAFLLFLFVMTTDIHRLVFIVPPGPEGLEVGNYSYGWGYFAVISYIWLCALASYGIIFVKCRTPNKKRAHFLPLIPMISGAAFLCAHIAGIVVYFGFYHLDVTAFSCLVITTTLEACIQSGLILTNNGYDELFRKSAIRAVITDKEYSPIIYSDNCGNISSDDMTKTAEAPVILENGARLSSAPVKRGYVLWQDDLSELNAVLRELSETNDYLQGKSAAIQQAYDYQRKERRLIEKNRLYNRILTHTKPEIELYADLIEQLDKETDIERSKALAVKIAFVSAFIKRRDNLIFLSEEGKPIAPAELGYCVEESLSNLRLGGMECTCSSELKAPIPFEKMSGMYETFYKVLFGLIDKLSSVCVYLIEENGEAAALMRICCAEDIDPPYFGGYNIRAEKEESEWTVTIK